MYCVFFLCFFFFKQKTAYEMRISDWSSDVCPSDLTQRFFGDGMISAARFRRARLAAGVELEFLKQPYRDAGWDQVIGSSGTIRGIWRVMREHDWITDEITRDALDNLIELTLHRRRIVDIDFRSEEHTSELQSLI